MLHRSRACARWLVIAAFLLPLSAAAQPPRPAPSAQISGGIDIPQPASSFMGRAHDLQARGAQVDVLIELWDAPALVAWSGARRLESPAAATLSARTAARTIESAQQLLLPSIAQAGGRVLYRLQRTLNGIAAHMPADRLDELRRLPSVKTIRPIVPKTIDNASSVSLIGAPQLWGAGTAARGEGIKIGVIDTGIDYLHTDFGGSGRAADYQRNDTTTIDDGIGFPSVKVVGGYDFAGDAYDASRLETFFPQPDPDPMDCGGHGTHVAGTVAGYGVNANGTAYAGPWSATGVPTSTMRIGPGVAPKAELYALRIFGCAGSTALVAQALDWATDPDGNFEFSDHLDVVNLSLGAPFGGSPMDPDVDAVNNAALAGVVVVAAAGNSGDTFYDVGAPSTADWAISVASSFDATAITGALRVNAPAAIATLYAADEAEFGPDLTKSGPLTGAARYPNNSGQNKGCSAFNQANAALIKGKIAVMDRGSCSFKTKVNNAQAAGAIGALIVNNVAGYPSAMADDPSIATSITIPSMITTLDGGNAIKAHLADPGGVSLTLTAAYRDARKNVDQKQVDSLSTFTARGPRRGDGALKPDLTAPGDTIFSAAHGTGSRGVSFSGTSMATPHVAGALALLRQLHPDWTVEELKALVMNSASAPARSGGQTGALFSPSRQGAGRVTLQAAGSAMAVAYNADNPGQISVSFGAPQVVGSTTLVKNIRVANKRGNAVTYSIGVANVVTAQGVTISPLASSVTIPAYGSTTFAVRMTADAALLDRTLDPATAGAQDGVQRQFLNEHSGYITLVGPDTLRVPFYVAPRPASDMRAANGLNFGSNGTSAVLTLRGSGLNNAAYRSRAWALQLQEHNPNDSFTSGPQDAGDMKYIGVGSDVAAPGALTNNTLIYFGIATFGTRPTANPLEAEFDIYIDVDGDHSDDFVVFNWSLAQARGSADPSDVFVATVADLKRGVIVNTHPLNLLPASTETAPFNSTVMVLPVSAGDMHLTAGRSRFSYRVFAFQREYAGPSDGSYAHSFDPAAPALIVGGGALLLDDLNGTSAQVRINRESWLRDQAQGLLLLHALNAAPQQAEEVPVAVSFYRAFLPVVGR